MKSFGKIIAEACERQGLTHADLAHALGYAQPSVTQILGRSMTERSFRMLAAALDLDVVVKLVPRPAARRRMRATDVIRKAEATKRLRRKSA
jgi:transcriptional regulator with XRE-family HTH domain